MPNINETSLLAYIAKTIAAPPQQGVTPGRRLIAHETLLSRVQELILPGMESSPSQGQAVPVVVSPPREESPQI